jgi:hypothetical protein
MPKPVQETARVLEAGTGSASTGNRLVQLISPGWGSSGHYSSNVLEQAVADDLFPAGLHMYADHPTATESKERPVRSIKDLISITTSEGRIATDADVKAGADIGSVVAEVRVIAPYRELIDDLAGDIGVSIRGDAEVSPGVAEGRSGNIVESLAHIKSVDWVTRAGRGGKVLQVLESARDVTEARNVGQWVESRIHRDFTMLADDMAGEGRLTREERIQLSSAIGDALAAFVGNLEKNAPQLYQRDIWADPADTVAAALEAAGPAAVVRRAIAHGVAEATANDTRDALYTATRAAHGSDETWVWVRDFDDSTVWFDVEGEENGTYAQDYTHGDDGSVALTGERTAVRVVTTYVPATRPDGTTTEESKEDTMGKIQIEEAEHTSLVEKAGRVDALESENATLKADKTKLEEAAAARSRSDRASELITEAAGTDVQFTALERAGLVAALPLTESGELDEAAFTTTVNTHVAEKKKAAGAGSVRGFGGTTIGAVESADEKLAAIDAALGIQKGA